MKVQTKDLKQAIKKLKEIAQKNKNFPILENYLVTAQGNKLTVSATNLNIYGSYEITAESADNFAFLIPAKQFNLVSKFKEKVTDILVTDKEAVIKNSLNYTFKIRDDYQNYAAFPKTEKVIAEYSLTEKQVKRLLDMHKFTSKDKMRENLQGLHFQNDSGYLKAIVTDGHRIVTEKLIQTEKNVYFPCNRELVKALKHCNNAVFQFVKIDQQNEMLKIISGNVTYFVKRNDGYYPDWERVIPDDDGFVKIETDRKEFESLLSEIVELHKQEDITAYKISFDFNVNQAKVFSYLSESEIEIHKEFPVKAEKPIQANYNARLLLEMVKDVETEKLLFGINESGRLEMKIYDDKDNIRMTMPIK